MLVALALMSMVHIFMHPRLELICYCVCVLTIKLSFVVLIVHMLF